MCANGCPLAFALRNPDTIAAPAAIEDEVARQFEVQIVGRTDEVKQSYYAISVERRLRHPAVVAVAESARKEVLD